MTTSEDLGLDSNASDFDNSDEDLASLLGDDDDDIFAKKISGGSPLKKSLETASSVIKKPTDNKSGILPKTSAADSPFKKAEKSLKITEPNDDFADDILNDFIDSKVRKKSIVDLKSLPVEKKSEGNKLDEEDDDFLDDLSLNQFSPSKDLSISSPAKSLKNKISGENSKDFGNVDKGAPKPSKERRGSFFDDFLQKLSPKHDAKKTSTDTSLKKVPKVEETEEDILGTYIPTAPPKNETTSIDAVSKSPKRRGSLYKQVSFKDLPDDFSETLPDASEAPAAPTKEVSSKQQPLAESKRTERNSAKSKKTESSKSEDMDWLNFFKETPKPSEPKKDETVYDKKELPNKDKSKIGIRRQSSADWLGLSESKVLDEDEFGDGDKIKNREVNLENLKSRPKTADAPIIRPRSVDFNKKIDEWNDDNDLRIEINPSEKSDLSQILKQTSTENRPSLATPKRSATKPSFLNPSSKNKFAEQVTPKMQITSNTLSNDLIPDHIITPEDSNFDLGFNISSVKEAPLQSIHKSSEQTSAIHSLQLLLDNSMQERNKLLKENETLKLTYEEKIKTIEDLHKTEKKSYDDLYSTIESGLKKEFEIKIKSLEERLNTLSAEKEKQETNFKEKLENVLKEHQIEMQRLKDLHNQAIKLMKEDHEDALSRLRQLKEQELEAVLSTQVHAKSLQHLSDQLEARANELAELQNKVEGKNQSMLRDRQAMLDAKERDLKALQNRLQKQLEDGEEERTRLQQLVLRLESRLQKMTMEGEEDHWEVQQMKARLTVQQKYLEEEKKLNSYQIEKEKEKLRISQDSLLHEQKAVLLQLAQERQQFVQEKIDLQSLAKSIKEEEAKLSVKKLKEQSYIEFQKQYLEEEKNKLHFEKERVKQELYHLERERDTLKKERQQLRNDKENLRELEVDLKRKSAEIEELAVSAVQEQEKGRREHAAALNIKAEQKFRIEQYTQQMQMLMDKERQILLEKEKVMEEKLEFEKSKNNILCMKCKIPVETQIPAPPTDLSVPTVMALPSFHGITNQVQHSYVDPNLVIWHIAAQKDREFLQQELAFLQSLKDSDKYS